MGKIIPKQSSGREPGVARVTLYVVVREQHGISFRRGESGKITHSLQPFFPARIPFFELKRREEFLPREQYPCRAMLSARPAVPWPMAPAGLQRDSVHPRANLDKTCVSTLPVRLLRLLPIRYIF